MKRLGTLLPLLTLLLLLDARAAAAETAVTLDGAPLTRGILEQGVTWTPVRAVLEAAGFSVAWDKDARAAVVSDEEISEELVAGEDARLIGDTLYAPVRALAELADFSVSWSGSVALWSEDEAPLEGLSIVVDAGHGGEATGASYEGVLEKDLNLAIARLVQEELSLRGAQVSMTRQTDVSRGLYARSELANDLGADYFLSVHCNASENKAAAGFYTACYRSGSVGEALAEALRLSLLDTLPGGDYGTHERPNLAVLRTSHMPAVLVECGFMSNSGELHRLCDPAHQRQLAEAIASGFEDYIEDN
jgi:N-acetylmuramoyl-L-alanine amidase